MRVISRADAVAHETAHLVRDARGDVLESLEGVLYILDGRLRLVHYTEGWRRLPAEHGWLTLSNPPERGHPFLWYVGEPARRDELAALFRVVLDDGLPQEVQTLDKCGRAWRMTLLPWRRGGRIAGALCRVTEIACNEDTAAQHLELVGRLTAGATHDFNNLLLAIRGSAGLLLMDGQAGEAMRTHLQRIEAAAARATELSQQLQSFARPGKEKPAIIDFNEVARQATDLAKRAVRRQVEVVFQSSSEPVTTGMDFSTAVAMVLRFCLLAADGLSKGGQVIITNELAPLAAARARNGGCDDSERWLRCRIAVKAAGQGTMSCRSAQGTEAGLASACQAVRRAQGFVELNVGPDGERASTIFLPRADCSRGATELEFRQRLQRSSGRVLLVDDLDSSREATAEFLEHAGYDVRAVADARAAMRLLEENGDTFDLLLTDYAMPGGNGWQLARQALVRWPHLRCIMAAGCLDDAEWSEIDATRRVRLVSRPCMPEEIEALVGQLLQPPLQP